MVSSLTNSLHKSVLSLYGVRFLVSLPQYCSILSLPVVWHCVFVFLHVKLSCHVEVINCHCCLDEHEVEALLSWCHYVNVKTTEQLLKPDGGQ